MKQYSFSVNPYEIQRVILKGLEIIITTVLNHKIVVRLNNKEEVTNYINQLKEHCKKNRIGVYVYGYNEEQ